MHRKLKKAPIWNQKLVKRGPNVGFECWPTFKTSHCVHGIPLVCFLGQVTAPPPQQGGGGAYYCPCKAGGFQGGIKAGVIDIVNFGHRDDSPTFGGS